MIEFKGSHLVDRSREEVWPALQDPEVLKKCIPGCEEIVRIDPQIYSIRIKVGFGLVKGSFQGTVRITNIVEPESYVLNIHAEGRTGFADGKTVIRLTPAPGPDRTEIGFSSQIQVGGLIASVGARLFQGAAKSLTEQFFKELERCLKN